MSEYIPQNPILSVDVVPFVVSTEGTLSLLLSQRLYEPYKGEWSLPGVLVVAGETLQEAGIRALNTKAHISKETVSRLFRCNVYDSPYRDSRGPTISISYIAVFQESQLDEKIFRDNILLSLPIENQELPFDHVTIINDAVQFLSEHLMQENGKLLWEILGEQFTTPMFVRLQQQINPSFNITNAHRLLSLQPFLHRLGDKDPSRGKSPRFWSFAPEVQSHTLD